jgi:hypothetical protein
MYGQSLDRARYFMTTPCPVCGTDDHLNILPMHNSNTFTFNMLYEVGAPPSVVRLAPGFSHQDGNWYK